VTSVLIDDATESTSLFEPVGNLEPHRIGNMVECKACATRVPSTQSMMRSHANRRQRLSDGSMGTCADFWRRVHGEEST
jgi:hypothetical protein